MRTFYSFILCLVSISVASAQDAWLPSYRSAFRLLEEGNASEAHEQAYHTLLTARRTSGAHSAEHLEGLRLLTLIESSVRHFPQALQYAQQEVALWQATDTTTAAYRKALQNQGILYLYLDSLPAARQSLQQALRLSRSSDPTYGRLLYQLAQVYHKAEQHTAADSMYQLIIDHAKTVDDTSLKNQAAYYQQLVRPTAESNADSLYETAITRWRQSGDTLHTTYADAHYRWANAKANAYEWGTARALYARAKEVYETITVSDSSQYASVLNNLGMLTLAEDDARTAAGWIQQAYTIRQDVYAPTDATFWSAVDNLAMAYHKTGNRTDAIELYQSHLQTDTIAAREYPWQYAVALSNLASVYQVQEQYQQAEAYYRRAAQHLKRSRLVTKEQKLHQASVYYNVARNHQSLVRFDSAVHYFKQSVEIIRRYRGKQSEEYVAAISGMAALYHDMGYFVEADIFYQEALKAQESLVGNQNNTYANILNNYALTCQEQGNFKQANQLLQRSLNIKKALLGTDHPEYVLALTNVGIAHLEAARYEQARPLLEQVLATNVEQWGAQHPSVITSYVNLSRLASAQGAYPEAETMLQKAIKVAETYYGRDHPQFAKTQIEIANLYLVLGNYNAAKPLLIKSKEIIETRYGRYHPEHATVTQNLATLYEGISQTDTAEQLYREALAIDLQTLGKQHPSYAITLNNLASLYQNRGDYAQAEPLLEESLAISEAMFGPEHPAYTTTLLNLGLLYQSTDRDEQALRYLHRVVDTRKKTLGPQHPDYAYGLYSLAVLHHKMDQSDQAEPVFQEAIRLYEYQIREYFPALSEKEKSAFYRRIEPVIHAFRDYVVVRATDTQTDDTTRASLLAELYDLQLLSKAILLNASSKIRKAIYTSDDEALIEQYQQWISSKETLARLYALPQNEWKKQQDRATFLEERTNELEKSLSLGSAAFASELESQRLSWRDVQQQLLPNEAAVEIIRIEKSDSLLFYVALSVTATSEAPAMAVLPDGFAMENKNYYYYQNAVGFRIPDELSYQLYWQPIKAILPSGTNTVYVAPDGVYNKISLNSLLNPSSGQYLIEESNLRLLSSTRDLVKKFETTESQTAYLIGYPNYRLSLRDSTKAPYNDTRSDTTLVASLDTTPLSLFPAVLSALPGTEREIDYLADLLKQYRWTATTYLKDDAKEEVVKQMESPRLLHVATHGYFMSDLLTDANQASYGVHLQNIAANPLLRSGLLFAGAERSIHEQRSPTNWQREDGILTAYEALNLNLNGTELVVLSACETGLGEIKNGEGVYGLQRAFLIAGAHSVAMSLWNVNDRATAKLMQLFYQKWLGGQDKFSALRSAQLAMLEEQSSPYYWGAFVMIGR